MENTLANVLSVKDQMGLVTASLTDTVSRVAQIMNARAVGAVLVTQNRDLVGIFTERDLLRRVLGGGHDPATLAVSSVMTSPIRCASPETTIWTAMYVMTEARHRHLPVVHQGAVVGIVSIGDLSHYVSRQLRDSVVDLSTYISGPAARVELPYAAKPTSVRPDRSAEQHSPSFEGMLRFTSAVILAQPPSQ